MLIPDIPEWATIDSVPLAAGSSLATFAWLATGLSELKRSLNKRGEDDLIPGVDEHIRNPRRPTLSRRLIPITIGGTHDPEGVPYDDPGEGCDANLFAFQESVVETTDEVVLEVYLRGGDVLTGTCVVEDFAFGDIFDGAIKAVLDVSVGRKLLLEAGS